MSFSFLKNFGRSKAKDLGNSIMEILVKWDPEAATEAEIETMNEQFQKLTEQLEKARITMNKEIGEAELAKRNYNKKVEMAEILQSRINDGKNVESNTEALKSILDQIDELEVMVKEESEEAAQAREDFKQLDELVKTFGQKIKAARKEIENARKKMIRANVQKMKEEEKEQRAREMAGLVKDVSASSVALDAMNKAAEEAEIKARAAATRTSLISSPENDVLSELEKEMSGKKVPQEQSLSDRVSKLKKL